MNTSKRFYTLASGASVDVRVLVDIYEHNLKICVHKKHSIIPTFLPLFHFYFELYVSRLFLPTVFTLIFTTNSFLPLQFYVVSSLFTFFFLLLGSHFCPLYLFSRAIGHLLVESVWNNRVCLIEKRSLNFILRWWNKNRSLN